MSVDEGDWRLCFVRVCNRGYVPVRAKVLAKYRVVWLADFPVLCGSISVSKGNG